MEQLYDPHVMRSKSRDCRDLQVDQNMMIGVNLDSVRTFTWINVVILSALTGASEQ